MEGRAERQLPELRVIEGGPDGARCVKCGADTGIHPKWWYDSENELAPYCEACVEAGLASAPAV
jgi:NAD-dependent SIR2 family protein deacetylase